MFALSIIFWGNSVTGNSYSWCLCNSRNCLRLLVILDLCGTAFGTILGPWDTSDETEDTCPFRASVAVGGAVLKGRQTLHHLGKVLRLFQVSDFFKNLPKAKNCFLDVRRSAKLRGSCTEHRLRW